MRMWPLEAAVKSSRMLGCARVTKNLPRRERTCWSGGRRVTATLWQVSPAAAAAAAFQARLNVRHAVVAPSWALVAVAYTKAATKTWLAFPPTPYHSKHHASRRDELTTALSLRCGTRRSNRLSELRCNNERSSAQSHGAGSLAGCAVAGMAAGPPAIPLCRSAAPAPQACVEM